MNIQRRFLNCFMIVGALHSFVMCSEPKSNQDDDEVSVYSDISLSGSEWSNSPVCDGDKNDSSIIPGIVMLQRKHYVGSKIAFEDKSAEQDDSKFVRRRSKAIDLGHFEKKVDTSTPSSRNDLRLVDMEEADPK